jgi:hypothetical protein
MDATLADRSPRRWTARPGSVFIVETLALFAAMVAPYFLLGYDRGVIVNAFIVLGYFVIVLAYLVWSGWKLWRKSSATRQPLKVSLLILGFRESIVLIALGLTFAIIGGWIHWAYRIEFFPGRSAMAFWATLIAILVLAPALFLALARPRGEGTPANDFLATVRDKGLAPFRESWLCGIAVTLAIICSAMVLTSVSALVQILEAQNLGEELAVWELALAFPYIPLGLIATAAMLSIFRITGTSRKSNAEIVQAYAEESADFPAPASATDSFGGLAVTCAWVITLYAILYPVHFGVVAALSSVVGISPALATADAVETWVEEQRAEGKTGAEMAAILNEYGRWSEDTPDSGLPELFPDLKDSLPATSYSGLESCSITLAAGVADPAAVSGVDWLEPEQAASDLRYCIRTACPSPVAWNAPDTVLLASSHASHNEQWMEYAFIDVFAQGRAPAPGGYCTADGKLADGFQG